MAGDTLYKSEMSYTHIYVGVLGRFAFLTFRPQDVHT